LSSPRAKQPFLNVYPEKESARLNIIASALLASLLLLAGCASNSQPPPSSPPPLDVIVVPVQQKDVPIYGDWVATLDGYVNANIQPQVSGYLIKQSYREGSFVHKEDILFEIDPRPFQAALDQAKGQVAQARGQLAQAEAQLALSKINVQRNTPLAKARAIAQSQLDTDIQTQATSEALIKTNQAAIQGAEAAVEVAQLNLGFTKVRSLISGIAGIATTQIGNLVGPSTLLTAVSQVDPIKVNFPISEQEYLRVAGNFTSRVPLQLTLSDGSVYPHPGKIAFANRQVDPQTGTIRVVGLFANPGNLLRPGQFGRVRAMTALRKNAILVPQRAVTELQGRYQVAVVGPNNKAAIHTVKLAERVGEMWVVESGLNPGDRVISEGVAKVRDGMTVNPKPQS
jgi:membrane fusion protein, multidrug efflux system